MLGSHIVPDERLVSNAVLEVFEKHSETSKYLNNFSLNFKKSIGVAMKKVKIATIPLLPQGIVQRLKTHFNEQSYQLSFVNTVHIDEFPSLRNVQILNEKDSE